METARSVRPLSILISKIHEAELGENQWKSMQINENQYKSLISIGFHQVRQSVAPTTDTTSKKMSDFSIRFLLTV